MPNGMYGGVRGGLISTYSIAKNGPASMLAGPDYDFAHQ